MQLNNTNILLISPESWDHIFVSKHHYAVHLGKRRNKVYFLNPPSAKNEVMETDYENVWQVNYKGFPIGLRFFPSFLQKRVIAKIFKNVERLCKIKFNVVWSFDNSVFYDFSALPAGVIKISHIVDLNQDFQMLIAASTADICFCTTDFIRKRLSEFNRYVYKINHGITRREEFPIDIPGINKVKALYVGNISSFYFDWNLFSEVASTNHFVDFIFIGPDGISNSVKRNSQTDEKEQVKSLSNVYFVGQVPPHLVFSYLVQAGVLMLTYCADKFPEQLANPHKMMEYLASGKMIVATHTQEYTELVEKDLFLMSVKNKEYPQKFQSAIQSLAYWNSNEKQKARQAYAHENTYDKQIDRIEALISTLDEGPVN